MIKKTTALIIAATAILVAVIVITAIWPSDNRKNSYSSPNKTNSVTVSYDFASRPSVIYKGKTIWEYPGSGFNEEVFFDVLWQSEDTFILRYDDESHNGKYAEEYLITLE